MRVQGWCGHPGHNRPLLLARLPRSHPGAPSAHRQAESLVPALWSSARSPGSKSSAGSRTPRPSSCSADQPLEPPPALGFHGWGPHSWGAAGGRARDAERRGAFFSASHGQKQQPPPGSRRASARSPQLPFPTHPGSRFWGGLGPALRGSPLATVRARARPRRSGRLTSSWA